MTTFGVTDQGFRRKTVDDIVGEMEADQLASMYDDMDVSAESILGQQNGIVGNQLGEAWEELETLHNAGDIDLAEGRLLENACKMLGVIRAGSTKTHVPLLCDLDAGTTLTNGTHFSAVKDQPDIRFTPMKDQQTVGAPGYTALTSGFQTVTFECEIAGPIPVDAGSITVIATPIVGWNRVSQPSDAIEGADIVTDTGLRTQRLRALAASGSATLLAIQAKVAKQLEGIVSINNISVFENPSDVTQTATGRPPHSVEVLLFDGLPAGDTTNNNLIAQAIVDAGLGGVNTYGNSSGTALVLDGTITVPKTINFSRATIIPIYADFDLVPTTGYPGDAALKTRIAADVNAMLIPGMPVAWSFLSAEAFALGGVSRCPQVRLGTAPGPSAHEADIGIEQRSIGQLDTSRITINHVT